MIVHGCSFPTRDGISDLLDRSSINSPPDFVSSEICRWEVEEAARFNKRTVPVVYRNVKNSRVPERLARLNYIFFNAGIPRGVSAAGQAIKNLVAALRVDLGWIREHTRMTERALLWQLRERTPSALLRGDTLAAAEEWARLQPTGAPELTADQREFLAESRANFDREEVQLAKDILAFRRATGVGFLVPAEEALGNGYHDFALRYAVCGAILADDPQFEIVPELRPVTLAAAKGARLRNVLRPSAGIDEAIYSCDGTRILTLGAEDGYHGLPATADIWCAETGLNIGHFGDGQTEYLAFSLDGCLRIEKTSASRSSIP
jgi:hypothetical protein